MPIFLRFAFIVITASLAACSTTSTNVPTQPEPTEVEVKPFSDASLQALLEAEFSGQRGEFNRASTIYYQQATELQDPELLARATRLALYSNQDENAEELAALLVKQQPTDITAQQFYISALMQQGKLSEAFDPMFALYQQGYGQNFVLLAAQALETYPQTFEELLPRAEQAVIDKPDDVQLLLALGILQTKIDANAALATIRQAEELEPNAPHIISVEARILQQTGDIDQAREVLKQARADGVNDAALDVQYARLLTPIDLMAARDILLEVNAQYPDNLEAVYSLALISKQLKLYGEAEDYFSQLVTYNAYLNEAHYFLGLLDQRKSDMIAAADHYQQVELSERYLPAVGRLNDLWLEQLPTLQSYMLTQRQRYPSEQVNLYLIEAETLLLARQYKLAHELLSEAIAAHPDSHSLRYSRSIVSDKRQDMALIEEDLRVILADNPDHAATLNALGYSLTNYTDRYDEALVLIQRALKNNPGDPAILDSLGWAYFRLGDVKTALIYLLEAYKLDPAPEIAAHLGEALWAQGHQERALQIWEHGLRNNANADYIVETMRRLQVDI